MAGTYTKYPEALDNSTSLPLATDLVTPVRAEIVNRIRESVLAIESELGIDPSREYGSVRARLDALQSGSGGGSGFIKILLNGTTILPEVNTIDFTGDVTVTSPSPLKVQVEVTGGETIQVQENKTVTTNGQTSFTLSQTPLQDNTVQMFVNGLKQQYSYDYTVSGDTVTWVGSFDLTTSDKVEFWYLVDLGGVTPGPAPATDSGIDSFVFTLSGVYSEADIPAFIDPPRLVPSDRRIESVSIVRRTAGTSGTTRIDVLKRSPASSVGVSIFASSSEQPQIDSFDGDGASQIVTVFNDDLLSTGDALEISLEDVETYLGGPPEGPEGISLEVRFSALS